MQTETKLKTNLNAKKLFRQNQRSKIKTKEEKNKAL